MCKCGSAEIREIHFTDLDEKFIVCKKCGRILAYWMEEEKEVN